jgi:hypothetical protein
VYNVSMPLLARSFTDRLPFRVFDIPLGDLRHEIERTTSNPTLAVPAPTRAAPAGEGVAIESGAGDRQG